MVKKVLFWVATPVTMTLFVLSLMAQAFGETLEVYLHKFEGWSFDYAKQGWVRSARGGCWVKRG